MSISPRSPETSSTGGHYDRAALPDGVTAVTGVMDFLRLQRRRRFPPARHNEDLAASVPKPGAPCIPVDDIESSSRQRGPHRAPGQTICSYKGSSPTARSLLASLVKHLSGGATSRRCPPGPRCPYPQSRQVPAENLNRSRFITTGATGGGSRRRGSRSSWS
jgi:hypothetical protein